MKLWKSFCANSPPLSANRRLLFLTVPTKPSQPMRILLDENFPEVEKSGA